MLALKCAATIENEIVGQSSLHVCSFAAVDYCCTVLSAVVACEIASFAVVCGRLGCGTKVSFRI